MAGEGQDPTIWELYRGIERLESAVKDLGGKVVSTEVYLADKKAAEERIGRVESRVRDVEAAGQESEKLKRQQRLTISLAIASPILGLVVTFVATGGLVAR